MPDDTAAMEQFDRLLDTWTRRPLAPPAGVDPALAAAAEAVHARARQARPDHDFAQRLRATLTQPPQASPASHAALAALPAPAHLPSVRAPRWRGMLELAAAAAIVALLVAALLGPRLAGRDPAPGRGAPAFLAPTAGTHRTLERPDPVTVAILFIVDHSGSMSYDPLGGVPRIDRIKDALRQAVQSLPPGTHVGILVFNDHQDWLVPLTPVTGDAARAEVTTAIDRLSADGGTEIYPALAAGIDAIRVTDADLRHIILVSDGKSRTGTQPAYQRLVDDAGRDGITLSTIAIGDDADAALLQVLAERGHGRFHAVERTEDIPRVVVEEARATLPVLDRAGSPAATPAGAGP